MLKRHLHSSAFLTCFFCITIIEILHLLYTLIGAKGIIVLHILLKTFRSFVKVWCHIKAFFQTAKFAGERSFFSIRFLGKQKFYLLKNLCQFWNTKIVKFGIKIVKCKITHSTPPSSINITLFCQSAKQKKILASWHKAYEERSIRNLRGIGGAVG